MPPPPKLGLHVSISGGISNSVENARSIGCTAFQIFTRNPRGWNAKDLDMADVSKFTKDLSSSGIDRRCVIVHMPYLPNLSAPIGEFYTKSIETLKLEIQRCEVLGISKLVIHLGSHLGVGVVKGREQLVSGIRAAIETSPNDGTRGSERTAVLLENSAGQKNSIGSRFEDLRLLLDMLGDSKRFGICFDTCHAFAAGYDLSTAREVYTVMDEFDQIVGLEELKVAHLNDSKGALGARLDRHEHIGRGKIGLEGMKAFLNHDKIRAIPTILETPIDKPGDDKTNLTVAKKLING